MTPLDEFVSSVQGSFAKNRATSLSKVGLFVAGVIALSLLWSLWMRRRRTRRELERRIHAVALAARLTAGDLDDLTRIASAGARPLIEVMTVLAAFEHATAALLAHEPPTMRPADGSRFIRVRRLRKALGFAPLPAHLWLLTTRELVVGDSVHASGVSGHVSEVSEAAFAIDWPETASVVAGALTSLTIDRPDDARYLARVGLMRVEPLPEAGQAAGSSTSGALGGARAFFTHDEQPERQQDREYTRLRVKVPVTVQLTDPTRPTPAPVVPALATASASAKGPAPATPPSIAGTMVDVSAGGLALDLPVSPIAGAVVRGVHVRCWFTLDARATFEGLAAVVVAAGPATGPAPGVQHLRLSYVDLEETERDRLAAAVARHQGGPAAALAHG